MSEGAVSHRVNERTVPEKDYIEPEIGEKKNDIEPDSGEEKYDVEPDSGGQKNAVEHEIDEEKDNVEFENMKRMIFSLKTVGRKMMLNRRV